MKVLYVIPNDWSSQVLGLPLHRTCHIRVLYNLSANSNMGTNKLPEAAGKAVLVAGMTQALLGPIQIEYVKRLSKSR